MDAAGVKAFFDQVAGDWDAMRLTYYDERVIEQLAARTQLTREQTVVDVGTGAGFVAAGLAAHAGRVLGYDNAPSMLEVARANLDRLGVDNVELAEGDVADLPLPNRAVDASVANMVLHHATDPAAMVAEMARVNWLPDLARSLTRLARPGFAAALRAKTGSTHKASPGDGPRLSDPVATSDTLRRYAKLEPYLSHDGFSPRSFAHLQAAERPAFAGLSLWVSDGT